MTAVLSTYLSSRIDWRLLAGSGAFLASLTGGYVWGHHDAASACQARALADRLAVANATLQTIEAARRDAVARDAQLTAINADLQKKVTDYADELSGIEARVSGTPPVASVPVPACLIGADDLQRLRQIR